MKNIIIASLVALSAISLYGRGPGHGDPCKRIEKSYGWMKDSLNLNASQQQQISAWKTEACQKLLLLKDSAAANPERAKAAGREVMKEYRTRVRSVLSKEQMDKLEAHRKALQHARRKKH